MGSKSDPKVSAGATAVPPLRIGKREGESEDEKQVSAKKQKRDEVVEEQKNNMEIFLDDSFSDSEPDMNPEAKKASLSKQEKKGKPDSANCSSSFESLADRSEKDEGNMDIDEGDYSEESNEETPMTKLEILVDAALNAPEYDLKNVENDSFSDTNSSDVEKPHMVTNPMKSSENSEQEIDEEASKTPQENPKTLFTPEVRQAGSKTIYTKNLSYSVERADLENLFKECGEIVDIRLHTYPDGRFKGFGHVEFATAEAAEKALQLHNTEVLRCPIRVGLAREYTHHRSFHDNFSNSFERTERFQCGKDSEISEDCEKESEEKASKTHQKSPKMLGTPDLQNTGWKTIYTTNLSYSVEQTDLENLFKECGEIVDILLHTYPDGRLKGYGHVVFATAEAAQKALELNNTVLLGRRIGVCIAEQKRDYNCNRSFHNNFSNSFERSERFQRGNVSEISEDFKQETEEKASQTHQKSPKMLFTLDQQNAGWKTIYTTNLSYNVERTDLENLFKECGEIVDILLHTYPDGRLKGYGHVVFATAKAAQKALELNNTVLLGRRVGVCIAEQNAGWKTIYINNLSYSLEPTDLENLFKECGEIVDILLHTYPDGRLKGYGHVVFATAEAAQKALDMDNTILLGRRIGVYIAEQKRDYNCNRSFHNNFRSSFDRSERFQDGKVSEISEDFKQETEEKASKTHQKSPKMLVTPDLQNAGWKTIYTTNLSYSAERTDLENLFKECGEIVDILLHTYPDGRLKGYGHVVFATTEAARKALDLNNTVFLGRRIGVCIAEQKRDYNCDRSFQNNFSNSFERSERFQHRKVSEDFGQETEENASKTHQKSPKMLVTPDQQNAGWKTIYINNLSYSLEPTDLENLFKKCGEIVDIRLHTYPDGSLKGYAHIVFATAEAAQKALELNNTVLLGRRVGVCIAERKCDYTCKRSFHNNFSNSFEWSERYQRGKGSEISEDFEQETEEKASKTLQISSKRLATPMEQNVPSKTIQVKNLSYSVKRDDIENLFKECGQIVDIRLHTDHEGRLNGLAHVEFATVDAAERAFEFHNTEFLRRHIGIVWAQEKSEYTYIKSNWSNSYQKCGRNQSLTVYVKGFDGSLSEAKIKASLEEHFGSCGEIAKISIAKFHDSGAVKGFAHLEFKDIDSVKKALYLDQTKLGGYPLLVEKAKPRREDQDRGGGGHQFGGRYGSGYSSSVGWGRSGGGGWHSWFYG